MLQNHPFNTQLKRKVALFSLPIFLTIFTACETPKSDVLPEKITDTEELVNEGEVVPIETDLSTANLIKNLKNGSNIAGFFSDNWTFAYIEDNRTDGSITGEIDNLKKSQINEIITLSVYSSGEGWTKFLMNLKRMI